MLVYVTGPGEDSNEIATRLNEHGDFPSTNDLARSIYDANTSRIDRGAISFFGRTFDKFEPYSVLQIPIPDAIKIVHEDIEAHTLDYLNTVCSVDKHKLHTLMQNNINIDDLQTQSCVMLWYNHIQKKKPISTKIAAVLGSNVLSLATSIIDRVNTRASKSLEKVATSIEKLDKKAIAYAYNTDSVAIRNEMRLAYSEAVATLNEYTHMAPSVNRLYNTVPKLARLIKRGILTEIHSLQDAKSLAVMLKRCKYLGKGLWAFGIFEGMVEVKAAHDNNEDWQAKAAGVTAGLVAGGVLLYASDILLSLLSFTPVGWVAIIGIGVVEVFTTTGLSDFAKDKIDDFVRFVKSDEPELLWDSYHAAEAEAIRTSSLPSSMINYGPNIGTVLNTLR